MLCDGITWFSPAPSGSDSAGSTGTDDHCTSRTNDERRRPKRERDRVEETSAKNNLLECTINLLFIMIMNIA